MNLKIGLETHIMLHSGRKLYCNCKPLVNTCQVCKGSPGTLPLPIDRESLKKGLKLGAFLGARLCKRLEIWRKHYDYYDLPNGFQRTQHPLKPLFKDGFLYLLKFKRMVQVKGFLEEDPAALKRNFIDHRRSGSPLLELVTEPLTLDPLEAESFLKQYLRTLKRITIDLGVCDKKRTLKTDLNLSFNNSCRYEVKNVSSIKLMIKALKESIPLLKKEDSLQNKTFNMTSKGLVFSRVKQKYIFLPELNLPYYKVLFKGSTANTFYQTLLNLQNLRPDPLNYPYLKSLYKAYEDKKLSQEDFETLKKENPKKGFRLIELKLKQSDLLRSEVYDFYTKRRITEEEYLAKTPSFLKKLKALKGELSRKSVPFSSYSINNLLQFFMRKAYST